MSPFLFNLIAETLNLLIKKAVYLKLWEGIESCRGGAKITHLQYADDTTIFYPPNPADLMNIKRTLISFHLTLGLQVNYHKSSIFGVNVNEDWLTSMASSLLCKVDKLPLTYLGSLIGGNASRLSLWDPIIAGMEKKIGLLKMWTSFHWR